MRKACSQALLTHDCVDCWFRMLTTRLVKSARDIDAEASPSLSKPQSPFPCSWGALTSGPSSPRPGRLGPGLRLLNSRLSMATSPRPSPLACLWQGVPRLEQGLGPAELEQRQGPGQEPRSSLEPASVLGQAWPKDHRGPMG